jgi:hypothetical protein
VPDEQRAAEQEDEQRFGLGVQAHLEHVGHRGERDGGGQCAEAAQEEPGVGVDQQRGQQGRDQRRQADRVDIPAVEQHTAAGVDPVLHGRSDAERLALHAWNEPVVPVDHLESDLRPRRFLTAQRQRIGAEEIGDEHQDPKGGDLPFAPPGAGRQRVGAHGSLLGPMYVRREDNKGGRGEKGQSSASGVLNHRVTENTEKTRTRDQGVNVSILSSLCSL